MKFAVRLMPVICLLLLPLAFPGAAQSPGPEINHNVHELALPPTLGRIESRFQGESSFWIIYVQDVHAHLTAQENIASILVYLNEKYGIRSVGVEGSWHQASFSKSRAIASSSKKQALAQTLMEEHFLTAPGYAALFAPNPLELIGIEDQTLYNENHSAYVKYLHQQESFMSALIKQRTALQYEKQNMFNPELYNFDQSVIAYENGFETTNFLESLMNRYEQLSSSADHLDAFESFIEAYRTERSLDMKGLESESLRLMEQFSHLGLDYESLLRSGNISAEKLEHYPQSSKYLELMTLKDNVDPGKFAEQVDFLIDLVYQQLTHSDDEAKLISKWKNFHLAEKIITLKASPDDVERFRTHAKEIQSQLTAAGLGEALENGSSFYRLAVERDLTFYNKLSSLTDNAHDIAVVTGGFHTNGLSAKLRKAGISHVVISPNLGEDKVDQEIYHKLIEAYEPEKHALAFYLRYLNASFDESFARGMAIFEESNNLLLAAEAAMTQTATAADSGVVTKPALSETAQALLSLPRERQLDWLRSLITNSDTSSQRLVLVTSAADLDAILKHPVGQVLGARELANRTNTFVIVYDDILEIPDATIGARAKIDRVKGGSVAESIERSSFQGRYRTDRQEKRVAAIVSDAVPLKDDLILRLKASPAALLFRIILETPELRESLASQDAAFFDLLNDLLAELNSLGELKKAA